MAPDVRTVAILPVKRFAAAKLRLSATLGDEDRERLAGAMVSDVLAALAAARELGALQALIVVTSEPSVAPLAHRAGAFVVADPQQRGQSEAVALGIARAIEDGAERVLLVPGDCPALDPREVVGLLRGRADGVVIAPDRHETGTNALVLAPPDAIEPAFGPGSCERHERLATEAGVAWRTERPASLLLDVDTAGDLATLRRRLEDGARVAPAQARMTRTVLAALAGAVAG